MRQRFLILPLALVLLAVSGTAAMAESSKSSPKMLGTFGNWKAYSYDDKNQPVCYMTLVPKLSDSKKLKRGQAYLTITHRPSESSKDVVSYVAGYNYKTTSDVTVAAGKKDFNLFTQKDTAWSRDASTDRALSGAIRGNSVIKISGTPDAKGAGTVADTITTKGATEAYQAISKACGYPVEAAPHAKKAAKKKH